jgi:hypothetical protein
MPPKYIKGLIEASRSHIHYLISDKYVDKGKKVVE